MQTIYYTQKIVVGKLLKTGELTSSDIKNEIIFINSNDFLNISKWVTLPKCILIYESGIFSHFVSYCISNEIPIGIVSNEEIELFINNNIVIDFYNEIITLSSIKNLITKEKTYDNVNIVQTVDGTNIELYATIKNCKNAMFAKKIGIKSAGLISTEFFYLNGNLSYDECKTILFKICENFKNGTSSIRLFDYDENKSNSNDKTKIERGVRAYNIPNYYNILINQLKSCMELNKHYNIEIVIPFVTNIDDIIFIKSKLKELNIEIPLCAMIENPVAFLSANQFSDIVNSFSIGTNDLLQYFFASDRDSICSNNNYINPYSRSLMEFLSLYPKEVINKTRVCGQLPIYPYMLQVLIQLGFRKFSIPAPMIPFTAKKINNMTIKKDFINSYKTIPNDYELKKYIVDAMLK